MLYIYMLYYYIILFYNLMCDFQISSSCYYYLPVLISVRLLKKKQPKRVCEYKKFL